MIFHPSRSFKIGPRSATALVVIIFTLSALASGTNSPDDTECEPDWKEELERCPSILVDEPLELDMESLDIPPDAKQLPAIFEEIKMKAKFVNDPNAKGRITFIDENNCPKEDGKKAEEFEYTIKHKFAVFYTPLEDPNAQEPEENSDPQEKTPFKVGSGGEEVSISFSSQGPGTYEVHLSEWGIPQRRVEGTDAEKCDEEEPDLELPGSPGSYTYNLDLLPVEVISDLNNNGKIDDGDRALKRAAQAEGATEEDIEKATEYMFANDNLSNGAWDKDDPDAPEGHNEDDDAEEISVTCAATWGAVWFEHPAIEKLSFYKTKECLPDDKLTFPFALSDQESGKLPEKLYVRLDGSGFAAQAEGDLVMKFGKSDKSETWAEDKIKFTVVKQLGDEKFFEAARDYILERNTKLFAHNWGYPVASPTTFIRMCVMREEATTMHPYESYHNDAVVNYNQASPGGTAYFDPVLYAQGLGIEGVMSVDEEMTVVINGNQCAFSNGTGTVEAYVMFLLGEPLMTDKCQGRVVIGGSLNPASNDHYDPATNAPGTSMKGSYLAGPDPIPGTGGPGGKYIAQTGNAFQVGAGVLPATVSSGMGGLSSSYNLGERSGYPNSMVGYVPMAGDGKGVVFTACGINFSQGNGKVVEFYQAARDSKVPDISGATQSNGMTVINLLLLDSGNTSPALAHQNPSDSLKLLLKGSKHDGNAYYTNTFLRFKSQRPRNTSP